jgi:hypothetical protein
VVESQLEYRFDYRGGTILRIASLEITSLSALLLTLGPVVLALLKAKIQFRSYGDSFVALENAGRVSIQASVHTFFLEGRWTFRLLNS